MPGTTMEEVQTSQTTMGYDTRNAEMEDDFIEVYFVHDGQRGEIDVDPAGGTAADLKIRT